MLFRGSKPSEPEVLASTSDYSIFDLAEDAGFLLLKPSDLVFESSSCSIDYYDYIISVAQPNKEMYQLYLAKLNEQTNVEWFESVDLPKKVIKGFEVPECDLALIIIGVLAWKAKIAKSKVLCLVNTLRDDTEQLLQALKKSMAKLKCLHHVICFEKRKSIENMWQNNRPKWQQSVANSMRLRVMMCEFRTKINTLPLRAIRETRYLLNPSYNPLCCLCLPFS